jgi:integrase
VEITMAQGKARLSAVEVRQVKPDPTGKSKILPDGGGLRLVVHPNGSKYWQFRTTRAGKETSFQLGIFPQLDLASARELAEDLRKKSRAGIDLTVERKLDKLNREVAAAITFRSVAEELLSIKKRNGISDSYHQKIEGALRANLYPALGDIPIGKIEPALLKSELKPIEARGSLDMLRFVLQIAGEVFDLAKADGRFVGDNPALALRRNVFAKHKKGSMKALNWDEMPGFLHRLDGFHGEFATACCIRLTLWSVSRPGEARHAEWSEFDLDTGCWTIPAVRMKLRQEHRVPLPQQAIKMLKELKLLTGTKQYLFPAQRGSKATTISDVAILKAIRRTVGHDDVDAHGFRAVFRTHAGESLLWPETVLEAALAHGKKNAVVGAYDRATHYQERKKLLQWYADELDRLKRGVSKQTKAQAIA